VAAAASAAFPRREIVSPVAALDVCIVSHDAYAELSGRGGRVGGVERQTALLARWLAARGHRVSMVTWDLGQPDGIEIDGVRVFKVCRESDGWPIVRFAHPRWSSLTKALSRANAGVYYQNVIDGVTGQVALWCRARRRPFVYSTSSDSDCDPRLPLLDTRRERVLFRTGLRLADRIIVQTGRQQSMLQRHFRRDSTVIPLSVPDEGRHLTRRPGGRIAWVGRVCEVKRADRFLDLADSFPEYGFDLIGPGDGSRYATAVDGRARGMANVTVHGPLRREAVLEQLATAACLCCTSDIEGFPNTFLEAWSLGVPVLSTFDPDDTLTRERLGWFVADPAQLPQALRAVMRDDAQRLEAGARARAYYTLHHTPDAVMPQVEAVLHAVAAR
jgi:glycosyltransferase involved in cell wall biosynthesis